jgi:hypothetical protein
MKAHVNRAIAAAALAAAVAGSASCTSMVRDSASNSYLIIDSLSGFSGPEDDETGNNLQSDVLTCGGVIEDEGAVVFRLALKDPGVPTVPNVMTTNNFITVNRFRVTYTRTDGRNTPGVDVPHPWDGAFTVTVRAEGTTGASFSIVRVQAKQEPPLRNLANGFGLGVISTIAEVTFYGHDQTGRAVSVVGRMSVDFADFADPEGACDGD